MPNTTNFNWVTPADTDLVKDGAAAIRTLGNNIDASLVDLKGGTTGQVLAKASNADLDYTWSNVDPLTILDAKGDLITATAADTPARLAVGTNGQYLQADSTTATGLKWATISAGGMTEIASGSLTGTTIDITSISGSYNELWLYINGLSLSSGNQNWRIQYNSITTGTYTTSGIRSSSTAVASNTGETGFIVSGTSGLLDTGTNNTSVVRFVNYADTSAFKIISFISASRYNTGPANDHFSGGGFNSNTGAITSIQIVGNVSFDAGTYKLFGVK